MPAIHQRPAVLLKALLFAVLITFAIDSFVRRQVVGPTQYLHLNWASQRGTTRILPLNMPNDFL